MLLNYLNSAACFVLLCYALPVSIVLGGRWWHKVAFLVLVASLCAQALLPWSPWGMDGPWVGTFLNLSLVVFVTVWRVDMWVFLLHKIEAIDHTHHPMRRESDWGFRR